MSNELGETGLQSNPQANGQNFKLKQSFKTMSNELGGDKLGCRPPPVIQLGPVC